MVNIEVCTQCGRKVDRVRKGLCDKHYNQMRKYGKCIDNNPRTQYDLNEIIMHNDYTEIIIYDKYCCEKCRAIIDPDDVDKVKNYKWRYSGRYVVTTINKKILRLHRFVMNCYDDEKVVDHINTNTLDNRKSNLRICTQHQNDMNHKVNKVNKSGVTGVRYREDKGVWVAYIYYHNRNISLGSYKNKEDAIKARKQGEIKYFGEYRNKNNE